METLAICLNIGDRIQVAGVWVDSKVTGVQSYWRKGRRLCAVHLDNHSPIIMQITDRVVVLGRGAL